MILFNRFATVPVAGMLRRLFVLRLYAVAGQVAAIGSVHWGLEIPLPLAPMAAVVGLLALLNLVTWIRLQQPWPVTALEFFVQLLADVTALTVLLFYSGGSTNPFVSLYLLPIIIAAITLPPVYAWAMTALSVAAYSFLMLVYIPLDMPHGAGAFALHLAGMWLNFIVSAVLIAFFIGRMAASIRIRDQELARAREDDLRNEQIVALGSLAAGAAHELSTPLATMAVVSGELAREHASDTELAASLQILHNQVAACKSILTRLTAAGASGRAEGGHPVALDAWLDELVGQWQLMRPTVSVQTRWDGVRPAPQVIGEATLSQALLNLFNNAADAALGEVELEARRDKHELVLDILDRGPGFSHEATARAGEVFFTTKRGQGGFGLGLFLANATIERLGGRVTMRHRKGGGARVEVRLPLQALAVE